MHLHSPCRNQAGENRKSGRDEWVVQVQYVYVSWQRKVGLWTMKDQVYSYLQPTRTWVIGIINSLGRSNMLPNMLKGPACAMPMSSKVTFEPGQFPEFSLFPGPCSTAGPCHLGVTGGCRSTKRARILCANCHMKLSILTRGSTRRPFYRQTSQVIGRCPDMPTPRIGIS